MFKTAKILFLYTETPLHVGSGSSLGTVDLPIQRERHTNLPMIQSSGIKGKLRNIFEPDGQETPKTKVIFGPQKDGSEHAGALSVGDGRLLLFPVRSLAGIFAWITCPLAISRLKRDLALANQHQTFSIPEITDNNQVLVTNECQLLIDHAVVLEEFTFNATTNEDVKKLATWLAENALPSSAEYQYWRDKLKKDLVIVSDTVFTDFCKFSTDVVSRTKLDPLTKIVQKGALWSEENLPADSLLYAPLFSADPRMDKTKIPKHKDESDTEKDFDANEILELVKSQLSKANSRLQLGGNETVGRGIVVTKMI